MFDLVWDLLVFAFFCWIAIMVITVPLALVGAAFEAIKNKFNPPPPPPPYATMAKQMGKGFAPPR